MFETILCLAGGGLDSPEQGTKERLLAFGGRDAFLLQLRKEGEGSAPLLLTLLRQISPGDSTCVCLGVETDSPKSIHL